MVVVDTQSLKRKASRWQVLPGKGEQEGVDFDVDQNRYSILVFLRDIEEDNQDRWAEFIELLESDKGAIDEKSIAAQLLVALRHMDTINYDYITSDNPTAKKRRIDVVGNAAAADALSEYDELILLARTLWQNPDELSDIMGEIYQRNLGRDYNSRDQDYDLDSIFDLARRWSEVRYRWMNHALRDDPNSAPMYSGGPRFAKGNAANAMIHESNVSQDSKVVEFREVNSIGFSPTDRDIFFETYCLTPEEARQIIRLSNPNSGLRIGLSQVFEYCARFIDALVNWRITVLEASRRQLLNSQAYRQALGYAHKQALMNGHHQSNGRILHSVDSLYVNDLLPAIRVLVVEATALDAFNQIAYDNLDRITQAITQGIRTSPMNTVTRGLTQNVNHQRTVNNFPGNYSLVPPTGTSMIIAPRPVPPNRGGNTTT